MAQQHLGKTKLAIELAKKVNGEIISCDSMQIYKSLNIGTAKPTEEEMQGIKHYLIDVVEPNQRFSVSNYKLIATEAIEEILSKNKMPIVVGGTGLYVDSLIYNINYYDVKIDEKYRNELEKIAKEDGLEKLYEIATKIDPEAMRKISKNDKKRIIRVLEIYKQTGKTKTELEVESRKTEIKYNFKIFAINIEREILYDRINKRVDEMINNGLIEEVREILKKYKEFPTAMQGLGYKETKEYIDGKITKEELINKVKLETRRYAKRQLTWFRKNKNIIWLDGKNTQEENLNKILEEIV